MPRNPKSVLICLLLSAILLSGCGEGQQATPTGAPPVVAAASVTPTVTATPTTVVAEPTVTLTSVAAARSLATSTLAPPVSPPSPTATSLPPTSTPTISPTPTATPVPPTPTSPPPTATHALPTPTLSPVPPFEIIIDNRDSRFSVAGTWFTGSGGQDYQGDSAWAPRGIQNIAYVHPGLPLPGSYEVYAWWPADPNHDHAQRVPIQIHPTVRRYPPYTVYVNLQENVGRWNSLGTYYLADAFLTIGGTLEGNIVADAFRFVYRSPEQLLVTPTPLPTPIRWIKHPPTPLEQLTSGDLSARLGLVQWFYPHTPIIAREQVTFDDCRAFPREGCGGSRPGWRAQVRYQDLIAFYRVPEDYRFVAIELPETLAARQLLYLYGSYQNHFFRVDRYPDDTWHLSGADFEQSYATHVPLHTIAVLRLLSFVQTYGSVRVDDAAKGLSLRLYGFGPRVEVSGEDRDQLLALGVEFGGAVWPGVILFGIPVPTPAVDGTIWCVHNLLVAPGTPGRLYVQQYPYQPQPGDPAYRLLYSDDYGETWHAFPLPDSNCVYRVDMDYAHPDTLYASTCEGLFRWNGKRWERISPPMMAYMVAVNYRQPEKLWAVVGLEPGNVQAVQSDDGGRTWRESGLRIAGNMSLAVDPHDPTMTYALAGTAAAATLFRKAENSAWTALPPPTGPGLPAGQMIGAQGWTIDGATGAIYVAVGTEGYCNKGRQIWRTSNPNATNIQDVRWELVHSFGAGTEVTLLASGWSPRGLALYANLLMVSNVACDITGVPVLHRSLDGGQIWTPLPIK